MQIEINKYYMRGTKMKKFETICLVILTIIMSVACSKEAITMETTNNSQVIDKNIIKDIQDENTPNNEEVKNKSLVVYYSAQNHTRNVAAIISKNTGADIFEIVPKEIYTEEDLDWTDNNSRVTKEHNDEKLQNIELTNINVPKFDDYDTVYIGYPIWWGIAAWPVNNFIKGNDFTNKQVIPFCTSMSSGIGRSDKLLYEMTKTGNWLDGKRFHQTAKEDEIVKWLDSINK